MKVISLFIFLVFNSNIFAACSYTLNLPVLNFMVGSSNIATAFNGNLYRGSSNSTYCNNYILGFSQGSAGSYTRRATNSSNGSTLLYNLYKSNTSNSNLTLVADATSSNQIVSGSVSKNSNSAFTYYFSLGALSPSSLVRGGIYTDILSVEAQSGSFGNSNSETTQPLTININVPKSASLSLVNPGGSFDAASTSKTLDFGILSTGESLSFDIIVLSNAGYNLSISSSNNQILKLQGGTGSNDSIIGYNLRSNNSLQNLTNSASSPVILSMGSGVTPLAGTRIPVSVIISNVDSKVAGNYQDTLTLTISTTE